MGPCHTLADAVKEASVTRISAAVLDLKLGRVSIAPVARALSARSLPFIFYSGQAANDPIHAEWPDARIFSKPSPSGELIDALAMLLHQKPDRVF